MSLDSIETPQAELYGSAKAMSISESSKSNHENRLFSHDQGRMNSDESHISQYNLTHPIWICEDVWNTDSFVDQDPFGTPSLLFPPFTDPIGAPSEELRQPEQWQGLLDLNLTYSVNNSISPLGLTSTLEQITPSITDTIHGYGVQSLEPVSTNDFTVAAVRDEAISYSHLDLPAQDSCTDYSLQENLMSTDTLPSPNNNTNVAPISNKISVSPFLIPELEISNARDQKSNLRVSKRKSQAGAASLKRACWRCKRYKKPCNGKGSVCDTCVTSGFRIWPSALGCRRGNLETFMDIILPANAEESLIAMNTAYIKPSSWRHGSKIYQSNAITSIDVDNGDMWENLLYKVQSTEVHGPGILELIAIVAKHQRRKNKPDKVMTSAINATLLSIDFYHMLISTKDNRTFDPTSKLSVFFGETRKVSLAALNTFLHSCLTGRIKDWFATITAGMILVFSYILLSDAVAAIPSHIRDTDWPNMQKTVVDLRNYLYSTAQDLLNVLAKGGRLLDFECWHSLQSTESDTSGVRNPQGMQMVDQDEATYDAMQELQQWRETFAIFLKEDCWMRTLPFTVDNHLPIMSFARMLRISNR